MPYYYKLRRGAVLLACHRETCHRTLDTLEGSGGREWRGVGGGMGGGKNGRGWEDEEAIAAPGGIDPVHTRRLLRGGVPVSLGGLGVRLCSPSFAFATATVRNRPQPSATVQSSSCVKLGCLLHVRPQASQVKPKHIL